MIHRNANVITDFDPEEFQKFDGVEDLSNVTENLPVIVVCKKPKPHIIKFVSLIQNVKDYFADPMIRNEILDQTETSRY